jgi:hypothetical protein
MSLECWSRNLRPSTAAIPSVKIIFFAVNCFCRYEAYIPLFVDNGFDGMYLSSLRQDELQQQLQQVCNRQCTRSFADDTAQLGIGNDQHCRMIAVKLAALLQKSQSAIPPLVVHQIPSTASASASSNSFIGSLALESDALQGFKLNAHFFSKTWDMRFFCLRGDTLYVLQFARVAAMKLMLNGTDSITPKKLALLA